jgi:hypothetical protein
MTLRRGVALAVLLGGAVLAVVLLHTGGDDNPTVAHVEGQPIKRKQLDAVVDHFRLEAKAEGKPFPDESTLSFKRARNRLLGLLVYRAELRQAAARLGVQVRPVEVVRRLRASGEPGETSRDSFDYGSVETQLLYQRIFAKVTRGVSAPTTAELAARRNRAMNRFLAGLKRDTEVRYEPGYAPGP